MRCRDCKYWEPLDIEHYRYEGGIFTNEGWGKCQCDKIQRFYTNISMVLSEERDYLLHPDHDGYIGQCRVGEDFGCIHFEPSS